MVNVTFLADKHKENYLPKIITKATFADFSMAGHLIILLTSVEVMN